jgi:hypothetical protein
MMGASAYKGSGVRNGVLYCHFEQSAKLPLPIFHRVESGLPQWD